jgi:hypothetical protein
MFGTVIWDVYTRDEAGDVHEALEDIASVRDAVGWSGSGVYSFSSAEIPAPSRPLMYVGLATDLAARFAQHNGLVPTKPGSSKWASIDAWFRRNEKLGYAAFVQSPMHQAHTAAFIRAHDSLVVDWTEDFEYDAQARRAIARVEGMLIESARLDRGTLPPWNIIGGSKEGRARASQSSGLNLIKLLEGTTDSLFVARKSIRELSDNPTDLFIETDVLHAARMTVLANSTADGVSDRDIVEQLARMRTPGTPWSRAHLTDKLAHMDHVGYLDTSTRGR